MSEWKEITLGKVANIDSGFAFKSKEYTEEGNLRVVRGKNVTVGKMRWGTDAKFWDYPTDGLERYFLAENDIVIGMDGSKIGENRSKIKESDLPAILAQRVGRVRAKGQSSQEFLWHAINSDSFVQYIKSIHTGTSIPHISQKQIGNYEIPLPPLPEQRAIAEVLSSLDDKIDLLHRQNQTLEALAQTLFRQWFIERRPELAEGEAQDDWEEVELGDLGQIITGKTPSKKNPEYWGIDIPFITPTDYKNFGMYANKSSRFLSKVGMSKMYRFVIPSETIMVTCIGSDMGKVSISRNDSITNQQINSIIVSDKNHIGFIYCFLKSKYQYLRSIAMGGTTMPIINKSDFSNIKCLLPPKELLDRFSKIWSSVSQKYQNNQDQISTLENLRETLLPKLMSGQVRVDVDAINERIGD